VKGWMVGGMLLASAAVLCPLSELTLPAVRRGFKSDAPGTKVQMRVESAGSVRELEIVFEIWCDGGISRVRSAPRAGRAERRDKPLPTTLSGEEECASQETWNKR